ncbi:hypothetical protein [Cyanobium sp. NS01]|uniref:Hfq-related RNA-binding protein n=1 Tax=Cyanobium sp. NS01 TaxID=261284 RepID=UPI0016486D2B|nr:hypothetical protein [Cyanobium sp. NS01]QNI70406.1 hypothetical protein CyaNS01_01271 [Cyanobium sp. NS01]
MQSFLEARSSVLDTSLPSVRHVQDLIRRRQTVAIQVSGGPALEGVIRWQDVHAIALQQSSDPPEGPPLILINRDQVSLIRSLG